MFEVRVWSLPGPGGRSNRRGSVSEGCAKVIGDKAEEEK